jgi:hypothetical protein
MRSSTNLLIGLGVGLLFASAGLTGAREAPSAGQAGAKAPAIAPEALEHFEKKVRPLLVERCYACHSAAAKNVGGGLLLDSRAGVMKGGVTGPAVLPGEPGKSLLITAVHQTGSLKMPPGPKLPEAEIAALESWVKIGAPDPRTGEALPERSGYDWEKERRFWSFRPLRPSKIPGVHDTAWPKTAIDRFILARLEAKGLKPVRDADRRTLIRRVTFDLTGLPPTPQEVRAFLADRSPNAWEKVIDRLLASPHYGERWGRHWLDLVRYADTSGCNSDFPIPNAYKYRNYVIQSFNRDKPYDQFLREQIAGDLLPAKSEPEKYEKVIATGYLAIARRFGSQANEFHLTVEDAIDNLGKTMLGMSVSCARCHDHKYDPVPQNDYYALYGILQSTKFAFPGTEVVPDEKDLVILASGELAEKARAQAAELSDLGPKLFRVRPEVRRLQAAAERAEEKAKELAPRGSGPETMAATQAATEAKEQYEKARAELEQLRQRQRELTQDAVDVPRAYAVSEGTPENVRLHKLGNPRTLGDEVPRGFLQILGGQTLPKAYKGSGRLELARWITDARNPLTARVMVNRIWQYHFGRGLVATPSDFGARGMKPTHPELLEYLALQFIRSGWSIKAMHRQMLLSRTYRLASIEDSHNARVDTDNRLLWRYNRHRLDAESIRDAVLTASGALDRSVGEAHPFPPRRQWRYTQHNPFYAVYETDRRSVYLMQQRIKKHPILETFDGADPNSNTAQRGVSTTALQALFMMNDAFIHEQAKTLARRVSITWPDTPRRVNEAYLHCFSRSATPDELKLCEQFLEESRAAHREAGIAEDQLDAEALASLMRVLFSSNEFVFVE